MNIRWPILCAATIAASNVAAQRALPVSGLGVRVGAATIAFWRSDSAPVRWTTAPLGSRALWSTAAPGVETARLMLAGKAEAWRTQLVIVRLDPARLVFRLDTSATRSGKPSWTIDRAPRNAVFAVNAGQFRTTFPWGWVVLEGHQMLPPERAPLAVTMSFDSAGAVHWTFDGEPAPGKVRWAFQSYPLLLRNSEVPAALRSADAGLDVGHRDARLALGTLPDGKVLVAMTRFAALGAALGGIPFGLTVPEMAAVMGALGARDAVLLDGGISAQVMAGRGRDRVTYSGMRDVPLGLVAFAR